MSKSTPKKHVIGIVGGIGSGKSTVSAEFKKLGCAVIDADSLGHIVLEFDSIKRALVEKFGRSILADPVSETSAIFCPALAEIAFESEQNIQSLNAIVHPAIGNLIESQIAELEKRPEIKAIVLDAAILFEASWDRYCTCTVFVDAPESTRLRRVIDNRNWTKEMLIKRERLQFPLDIKADRCCYILTNHADELSLSQKAKTLFLEIIRT